MIHDLFKKVPACQSQNLHKFMVVWKQLQGQGPSLKAFSFGFKLSTEMVDRAIKSRYALPQGNFQCEAVTAIPNGSFKPFDCKSTSEHD